VLIKVHDQFWHRILECLDIIPLRGRLIFACSLSDVQADHRESGRLLAARLRLTSSISEICMALGRRLTIA
jgi:hypothetical protein